MFTRSASKAAATQPTPGTAFINNLLVSGQKDCSGARQLRDADLSSKHARRRQATACRRDCAATTAASRLVAAQTSTGPSAGPAPATGVASAPGVNVQETTYEAGPVRAVRSRHASPTGVAPVRLIFTSPSGRGTADELDASDVDEDDVGLVSPNAAFGARRNARSGQTTRFPTIASVPELVGADKENARRRRRSVDCLDISVGKPCLRPPSTRQNPRQSERRERVWSISAVTSTLTPRRASPSTL